MRAPTGKSGPREPHPSDDKLRAVNYIPFYQNNYRGSEPQRVYIQCVATLFKEGETVQYLS